MRVPILGLRRALFVAAALLLPVSVGTQQPNVIRVAAGGSLQAALDTAKPGDTIALAPGAEYVDSFVLPPRADSSSAFITIRTDGPALPAAGVRTGPQYAGKLAVIRSSSVAPALRTTAGTHHWRIENVEFGANRNGESAIIMLGDDGAQRSAAMAPHDLIFDRVYVHGEARTGQKRGIALNSASTQIVNSYIADIKAIGSEAQAICGWNGPGPFLIENNYLEAAGENVMFGGADPVIDQMVPTDIIIRRNHITRPAAWKDPVLAPPADVRAGADPAGAVPPGDYIYSVVAEMRAAGAAATSVPSMPASISVRNGGVALQWSAVDGADGYRVYRTGGGNDTSWRTSSTHFVDRNERGDSGAPPKKGSVWTVKNLLELKNAQKVVIDGNLFEHHWAQAQAGHAILFTPRNQGGRAPWSRIGDIRFTNNVVRGVSAGINISGTDDEKPSVRTSGIVIENNLFLDVGGAMWGEPGDFLLIGNGPENVRIEGNTVMQAGRAVLAYGGRHGLEVPGFVFRNNVLRHNRYGIFGTDAGIGKPALARYFPGGVFEGNVFAGGAAKDYPAGNRFLAAGALDDQLVSDGAGYRWKSAESVRGAGADFSVLRTTVQAAQAAPPRSKG